MIGIILPANNAIGLPETGLQKLSFCLTLWELYDNIGAFVGAWCSG